MSVGVTPPWPDAGLPPTAKGRVPVKTLGFQNTE